MFDEYFCILSYSNTGKGKGGVVAKRAQSKNVKVETLEKTYPQTREQQAWKSVLRYVENNRLEIFWCVLYTLVLLLIFAERAYCK